MAYETRFHMTGICTAYASDHDMLLKHVFIELGVIQLGKVGIVLLVVLLVQRTRTSPGHNVVGGVAEAR